jgi:S-adenosylmethionine:tRNA ribosyltransferase-isomerase
MNTPLIFPRGLQAHIIGRSDAVWTIRFNKKGKALRTVLEKIGETPTPPYITASAAAKEYQTVYAKKRGSVAAPTAGFHFTRPLMASLKKQGILFVPVTLHVGLGTFAPVKETDITLHKMHKEEAELSVGASRILNRAKKDGRRVIAVGTTATRLLESFSDARGTLRPGEKAVDLFAYPGYRFSTVDGMITNLHLPKSTLLMLVAAFIAHKDKTRGVPKKLLATYREAIKKKYRFYSFGDAMLIL